MKTLTKDRHSIASSSLGIAAVALLMVCPAFGQKTGATVSGTVTNAAGQPLTNGEMKFSTDKTVPYKDEKFAVTAPIGPDGTYKAENVPPGDYYVYAVQGDKAADQQSLTVKPDDTNITFNDDMTREEYLKSMTPEARKALEEYKKKNSEVVNANKVIAQLNGTLKTTRADLAAAAPEKGDVSKDVTAMKQATDVKPDVGLLWLTYGDTLQAQGNHMKAEDVKAGKQPSSDPDVTKEFTDAVAAYQKAVSLDSAAAKPNVVGLAADYNQLGNALTQIGKTTDATAAFDKAAQTDPSKAGMYYKNAAAVLYNAGQMDGALDAADKAIAADPNSADAYFIKGQALVTKTAPDASGKLVAPAGCVDAYQKFLQLAPNDPKVAQVKEILASLGAKVDTHYRAGKKS
jgi:tetratricopeptide (TPR) repeat protein